MLQAVAQQRIEPGRVAAVDHVPQPALDPEAVDELLERGRAPEHGGPLLLGVAEVGVHDQVAHQARHSNGSHRLQPRTRL
ncbi:hypothetical protein [Streptomyces sp. NPDC002044]|uniref:hypothetical protein n=1 Tax=Streptomyces sp. NPDC002044 TaxID=3154662 RepID=UPI0033199410